MLEELLLDRVDGLLELLSLLSSKNLGVDDLDWLSLLLLLILVVVRVGQLLGDLELLLSLELSLEDGLHDLLLLVSDLVKRLAQAHDAHGTLCVTDSQHVLVHGDGGKGRVTDLLTVGAFVLSIVEVPHIEETVDPGQEEQARSGGGPATVRKISRVVPSLHDGSPHLFRPDLGGPITDTEEELCLVGVSLQSIDGSVMLSRVTSVLELDVDLVLSSVCQHDVSLLSSEKILLRDITAVAQRGATENLCLLLLLSFLFEGLVEDEAVHGRITWILVIPPQDLSVSGGGDALVTSLADDPLDRVDWVVMTLLKNSGLEGLDDSRSVNSLDIEEGQRTVIRTTDNDVWVLLVEGHAAQRTGWQQSLLWEVGVGQVPDVGLTRHVLGHLLEPQHGVGHTDSGLSLVWVPGDLGGGSLDLVGVLEDHECLGGDVLAHVLGRLTLEILLEEINLVVLEDALGGTLGHLFGGVRKSEGGLSVHFLLVLGLVSGLGVVILKRPSSDGMLHSLVGCWNSICVNL